MKDTLKKLEGMEVSVLCQRYVYRGVLEAVCADAIILKDAVIVEVFGEELKPQRVLRITSPAFIAMDKIEMACPV